MADMHSVETTHKPMWVRFLLAFGCLIAAFASALFSTVAREQGHFWATLALASVALVLATLVGVTTVPVLARQVVGDRVRDAIQFDVTRVGIWYVASIVLIGIAALNTGNNLLYIIVAVMLGAILISGIASAVILRNVEIEVRLPERIFAGQPAKAVFKLKNSRRRLPLFSVMVKAIQTSKSPRWQWERSTFTFPPGRLNAGRLNGRVWVRLPDRQLKRAPSRPASPALECRQVYFPFIAAGKEQSAQMDVKFARRGCYRSAVFGICTRFPFAFLSKTRPIRSTRSVVVYPRLQPGAIEAALPQISGAIETFSRGQGFELYRMREYQAQDSVRHVDWKATAKSGSLMVREYARDDNPRARIIFDNPAAGLISAAEYENGVSLAASLAWHLKAEGKDVAYLAPQLSSAETIDDFLTYLASVEPGAEAVPFERIPDDGVFTVICTARPGNYDARQISERCFVVRFGTGGTGDGAVDGN